MKDIVEIPTQDYAKMQRRLSMLDALEAGGVDSWEGIDFALEEWRKENELDKVCDDFIEDINDILVEADVDQPAGSGCGYSIKFNEVDMKKAFIKRAKEFLDITNKAK